MSDINEFLFSQEHNFSDKTQATYRYLLELLHTTYPDPGKMDAAGFSNWLKDHEWADSTRYLAACAVRAFLKWGYGAKHPALAVKVKKVEPPPQRTLTISEVEKLYQIFQPSDFDRRDMAMLSIFLDTGLRASEICRLSLEHIHLGEENYLSVKVKGGNWDDKSLSLYTALDIDNWLSVRDLYAHKKEKAVFVGIGGKTPGYTLTRDGLRAIVRVWGERAGIEHISPHAFRRTSATLGAEDGASDQLMMKQFGWKSAQMVTRYTKRLKNRAFVEKYSPVAKARRLSA